MDHSFLFLSRAYANALNTILEVDKYETRSRGSIRARLFSSRKKERMVDGRRASLPLAQVRSGRIKRGCRGGQRRFNRRFRPVESGGWDVCAEQAQVPPPPSPTFIPPSGTISSGVSRGRKPAFTQLNTGGGVVPPGNRQTDDGDGTKEYITVAAMASQCEECRALNLPWLVQGMEDSMTEPICENHRGLKFFRRNGYVPVPDAFTRRLAPGEVLMEWQTELRDGRRKSKAAQPATTQAVPASQPDWW